jgi:hypothetical protein
VLLQNNISTSNGCKSIKIDKLRFENIPKYEQTLTF